jgi:hypothetical protein
MIQAYQCNYIRKLTWSRMQSSVRYVRVMGPLNHMLLDSFGTYTYFVVLISPLFYFFEIFAKYIQPGIVSAFVTRPLYSLLI